MASSPVSSTRSFRLFLTATAGLWLIPVPAPRLGAAPVAVMGTLADYIALGAGGATIGSLLVSDFAVLPSQTGATPIAVDVVQVEPLDSPGMPGLRFVIDGEAASGELDQLRIAYRVSGLPLSGALLSMDGAAATGEGAVTAVEILGPGGSPGAILIVFAIEGDSDLDEAVSLPAAGFEVELDAVIDGGPGGTASLGSVTNRFIVEAGVPVPEPATVSLVALGAALVGLGRAGRRHRPAGRIPVAMALAGLLLLSPLRADHREAPITALDPAADIVGLYAFRSPAGFKVTFILCAQGFLEPGNGPIGSPFDPEILYEIKVDNNQDAVEDIVFQVSFSTEVGSPDRIGALAGVGATGAAAPANSPPPVAPGTSVVPPRITSFSSPGLGLRQTYKVNLVKGGVVTPIVLPGGAPFFAVPGNAGPRTMDYGALFAAGTYTSLPNGLSVFAGTTDDPAFTDMGGLQDTFNFKAVLSAAEDAANANIASDTLSGFAVNSIAIEVPIPMLTRTGAIEPVNSPAATIGVWATTSRQRLVVRRPPLPASLSGGPRQVQRQGNPLVNSLIIGLGSRDRFSMDIPKNDAQFDDFFLDPALPRVLNALFGGAMPIPAPPRLDLLPLLTYAPPIAAPGTPAGPLADILRLNTGVNATPFASANRLGLLGGDPAGFPNGRRPLDDTTDIVLRIVGGGILAGFNGPINSRLGDGVNVNDAILPATFPYLAHCPSGRNRRHIDPGEPGCTAGSGGSCSP